ncbi:Hypothetical predicted protein [Paramuricea clavata]|uniref:Uncharacterized protein n=1 Tax=Paramuricea clavata TaxID=317549 RepID=A0A6S7J646_PARCT|nr:Hypothetical predicted protein [Paramuricea clavata]
MKDYNKYSKATICSHMKRKIDDSVIDERKQNKGRPHKLTKRDKRNILRHVEILLYEGIMGILQQNDSKFLLAYRQMFQMRQFDAFLEPTDSNTFIRVKRGCLAEGFDS